MAKPQRDASTPEQLDLAIGKNPCRYKYAVEVWPDAIQDDWERRVPPHAVIHALRRDLDRYDELLQWERQRAGHAERELAAIRRVLAGAVAAHPEQLTFTGAVEDRP